MSAIVDRGELVDTTPHCDHDGDTTAMWTAAHSWFTRCWDCGTDLDLDGSPFE